MDESTTLADLLSLNLHNYEEEVRNIVDKAVKEMSMEKVLTTLDNTWTTMEFEHEPHARTKITMLKTSEELIETLEDDQVSGVETKNSHNSVSERSRVNIPAKSDQRFWIGR